MAMIRCLIFRRSFVRVSRRLLQEVRNASRGGHGWFMEEGYDIEGFMLELLASHPQQLLVR